MTVGLDDGVQPAGQHPVEHVERRQGELELQRLVPDLFLWSAQEDEILDLGSGPRQEAAAQQQHQVDGAGCAAGRAQHVAQHDQPVAGLPTLHQGTAQPLQGGVVAFQRPQRPGGTAVTQAGDRGDFAHESGRGSVRQT